MGAEKHWFCPVVDVVEKLYMSHHVEGQVGQCFEQPELMKGFRAMAERVD